MKNNIIFLIIILSLYLSITTFVFYAIYPLRIQLEKPLFIDLIEYQFKQSLIIMHFINLFNIFLIWIISRRFYSKQNSLIAPLVYSLSPWSVYLTVTGSFNIFILCFLLITFLGILMIREDKNRLGSSVFIFGSVLLLYSSLLFILIYSIILIGIIFFKILNLNSIKNPIIIVIILCLPLLFTMLKNPVGVRNIYSNNINIFSDPGHTNIINQYQGETRDVGYGTLVKIAENKYIYLGKFAVFKFIKHLTPSTFFTSQEVLLKFSFTPPIYFGFIIPFFFGLYFIFRSRILLKGLAITLTLILPSFLFKDIVSLNKLIFFKPILIFIITFGLVKLIDSKNNRFYKLLLILTIFLVTIQFFLTLHDLYFREYARFQRFLGDILEIGKI